ncbi:unnamed protein product [Effrenium voratum]|nr:unnamed protein product [Effrenium voratum]
MAESIALNLAVLAAGLVIFYIMRMCRRARRRKSSFSSGPSERLLNISSERSAFELGPGFHSTALNYLIFLRVAAEMCTVLTVASALIVIPHWGVMPFLLGGYTGRVSLAEDIDCDGICLLCLLVAVLGVLVLLFSEFRMKRHMRVRTAMHPKYIKWLDQALWLTHLPVGDHATGKKFKLTDKDFDRVEESLKRAIEDKIAEVMDKQDESKVEAAASARKEDDDDGVEADLKRKVRTGALAHNPPGRVLRVHVAFVVDDWYRVDSRHKETCERLELRQQQLEALRQEASRWCCWNRFRQRMRIRRLERQTRRLQDQVHRLGRDLTEKERESRAKKMSGSAFVTFQDKASKQILLKDLPTCWRCQQHAYFNFGQPPFNSVTLRCRRAPHPADVLWENLHISYAARLVRFFVGSVLLLIFMLVLVAPLSISSELNVFISELRRGSDALRDKVEEKLGVSLPEKEEWWQSLYVQLPTMVLLFINSLLLPYLISGICLFQRSHTLSKAEINQMNLNYVFLVLNQLLIPLLGLTGMPALLEFLEVKLNDHKEDISILQLLDGTLLRSPGLFYVRYLLNCAFMTNTNSLLNLPQLCMRWLFEEAEPWPFAWGYWYAFALATLTTAVSLGSLVPALFPIGALLFGMKYRVDKHILNERAYLCGPESQGLFLPRVLFIMRMMVVGSWLAVGSSLRLTASFFQGRWDSPVPLRVLENSCSLLVAFAVLLGVWSLWEKGNDVHTARFEWLCYSGNKEHESNLFDRSLDAIFGKLGEVSAKTEVTVQQQPSRMLKAERCNSEDLQEMDWAATTLDFSRRNSREVEEQQTEDSNFQLIWDCRRWTSFWPDYRKRAQMSVRDIVSSGHFDEHQFSLDEQYESQSFVPPTY